ncbi:MAG: kelch repeat-containing protein [Anaerolineae bacterium]
MPVADLGEKRAGHTETLLANGKVLVVGGRKDGGSYHASAELYDPTTNTWSSAGSMSTTRGYHTATLLPDGRVLVAGGYSVNAGGSLGSSELYDPTTNTWALAASMNVVRDYHTATLLPNGKVLVVGGEMAGYYGPDVRASAEVYDPATNTWTMVASMTVPRYAYTATLLPTGKVLVVGGGTINGGSTASAELYDPAWNTWATAASLSEVRSSHTATLLPNGKVFIVGGSTGSVSATTRLYDPTTDTWAAAASLNTARTYHSTTLLANGKVLVAGGWTSSGYLADTEVYDPTSDTWSAGDKLNTARSSLTATRLANGNVLVVGGEGSNTVLSTAELYIPGCATPTGTSCDALLSVSVAGPASLNLTTGRYVPNPFDVVATVQNTGSTTATDVQVTLYLPKGLSLASGTALQSIATLAAGGQQQLTWSVRAEGRGETTSFTYSVVASASNTDVRYASTVVSVPGGYPGQWMPVADLAEKRAGHTETLLPNGKVLVVGGRKDGGTFYASAELYDPTTNTWSSAGSMSASRGYHTATLLPDGRILVVGGYNYRAYLNRAELYDPITNSWSSAGSMSWARAYHTATLLPNGKVFVTGGVDNESGYSLLTAELYDPTTNTWSAAQSMSTHRYVHTATLLLTGKVLVVGGADGPQNHASAELYDPAWNTWSSAASMSERLSQHSATLLPNGKVLITGGATELYDPTTDTWSTAASMTMPRSYHTTTLLPNGKVLVVGGMNAGVALADTEIYDPSTDTWAAGDSLNTARRSHTAAVLNNGNVLVVGGDPDNTLGNVLATGELYIPGCVTAAGQSCDTVLSVSAAGPASLNLTNGRYVPNPFDVVATVQNTGSTTATDVQVTLYLPKGLSLASGNAMQSIATLAANGQQQLTWSVRAEGRGETTSFTYSVVASASNTDVRYASTVVSVPGGYPGQWMPVADLAEKRAGHTETLLPNGKVLVVGGRKDGGTYYASAELYDPTTNTWSSAGSMSTTRGYHTATLLPDGRVLVAGGYSWNGGGSLASSELYDPTTNSWSPAGDMSTERYNHTATLLPNGKVLVVGGVSVMPVWHDVVYPVYSTAELYDPVSNIWFPAGSMSTARFVHTATLLPTGKVLVVGGADGNQNYASAELYDPASNAWSRAASLSEGHNGHTATLLPNGKVLITGGSSNGGVSGLARLYDPTTDTWAAAASLDAARTYHSATLLPNGKVLVAGGWAPSGNLADTEVYDPTSDTWTVGDKLNTARSSLTATRLANGNVLVVGGEGNNTVLPTAEVYIPGCVTRGSGACQTDLLLTLNAPSTLSFMGGQYSPNPFQVIATVQNRGIAVADEIQVTLSLPKGLTLASGTVAQSVSSLAVNSSAQISWTVRAEAQSTQTPLAYFATAQGTNTPVETSLDQVTIPGAFIVESVYPKLGGNTGFVTVEIRGSGFREGVSVQLGDLAGEDTVLLSPERIKTTFDLRDHPGGDFTLQVTNPGEMSLAVPGTFNVVNGGKGELGLDLFGPTLVRLGREAHYIAVARNIGLIDLESVEIGFGGLIPEPVLTGNQGKITAQAPMSIIIPQLPPGGIASLAHQESWDESGCGKQVTARSRRVKCEELPSLINDAANQIALLKGLILETQKRIDKSCRECHLSDSQICIAEVAARSSLEVLLYREVWSQSGLFPKFMECKGQENNRCAT